MYFVWRDIMFYETLNVSRCIVVNSKQTRIWILCNKLCTSNRLWTNFLEYQVIFHLLSTNNTNYAPNSEMWKEARCIYETFSYIISQTNWEILLNTIHFIIMGWSIKVYNMSSDRQFFFHVCTDWESFVTSSYVLL